MGKRPWKELEGKKSLARLSLAGFEIALLKNNIVEYIKYRINHLLHSSFVEYGESFHS